MSFKESIAFEHENLLVNDLKKKNEMLKRKNNEFNDIVLKFTNGQNILDNLLGFKNCIFDKGDIDYKPKFEIKVLQEILC